MNARSPRKCPVDYDVFSAETIADRRGSVPRHVVACQMYGMNEILVAWSERE